MRSSGNTWLRGLRVCRKALVVLASAVLLVGSAPRTVAQGSRPAELFAQAKTREAQIRRDLGAHKPGASPTVLLDRVRTLASAFEDPGSQGVHGVAFSPRGDVLAAADGNGRTYLWKTSAQTEQHP